MKLFEVPSQPAALDSVNNVAQEAITVTHDFKRFSDQVFGYCSVGRVYDQIAQESLSFIDTKNSVLYNEYVSVLSARMGVDAPKSISMESLTSEGQLVANYQISLEGWMKDVWEKIKAVFEKIYNAVKKFYNTYFTRFGRLKKSLDNLEQVLRSTTKDLGDPSLENPPSPILKAFSGNAEVTPNSISGSIDSVKTLVSTIGGINGAAIEFSKSDIVGPDFIKRMKELKDKALKANEASAKNREERDKTKMFGDRDKKKALDTENKSLQDIAKSSEQEGENMAGQLTDMGDAANPGDEAESKKKAEAQFDEFMRAVLESFDKVKGKDLVNGIHIKSVSSDPEEGLKVEMDEKVDPATSLRMGNKASLQDLVKSCQDLLKTAETDVQKYGQVNDSIMKSFNAIDNLISDIDKVDPEKFGKYKKLINDNVRHRLNLLRKFFSTYNRTCKNIFDMTMDVSDATVKYSVLSLKHFE